MDVAQLVEPRVVIPVVVGSSPIVHPKFSGPLAQLVEQETLNLLVEGSNPSRPTNLTLVRSQEFVDRLAADSAMRRSYGV